jgi:hypothetical protein
MRLIEGELATIGAHTVQEPMVDSVADGRYE